MMNCLSSVKSYSKQRRDHLFNWDNAIFIVVGLLIGLSFSFTIKLRLLNCHGHCCSNEPISEDENGNESMNQQQQPIFVYDTVEPAKSLVFIGVMTAQKYLDTRANAVYETWGRRVPGKLSFFSRSGSSSLYQLPLVSLPGVDDSYPPQKKSFMMLKFMHDNYLNRFEWFMRVDDDVYIKPERIEPFLRSLNSSVPQFIGQAGLGNKDEFGLLSLDYDENFCMGGPGIVMSRETLRLIVPHISYCLKNLYSTHEDVEIGRCVKKFANISCTWSYEMQHIFHHNSSGNDAFTGDLLSHEVLRAISLHPIKQSKHLYRLHVFLSALGCLVLRRMELELHRNIYKLRKELNRALNNQSGSSSFYSNSNDDEYDGREYDDGLVEEDEEEKKCFAANRVKREPSLRGRTVKRRDERYDFDFFTRSLFSSTYVSPKRGLEGYWRRSLTDAIRQIMDEINRNSMKRGRLIDFKDLLYGYMRHQPSLGVDYIIDMLLVYRKYEGKKMTVPVRRHAYVRQTYTSMLFREDEREESIFIDINSTRSDSKTKKLVCDDNNRENADEKGIFERIKESLTNFLLTSDLDRRVDDNDDEDRLRSIGINKSFSLAWIQHKSNENANLIRDDSSVYLIKRGINEKTINFVMPLSGRMETFNRFMANYEEICLRTNQNVNLIVVLFVDRDRNQRYLIENLFGKLKQKYARQSLNLIVSEATRNFSRAIGCELGYEKLNETSLVFFIDVDMIFTYDFLYRVRLNTIEGKQVYYPIVYSEYDPNYGGKHDDHFRIDANGGYWRQFGFGLLAAYKSDLRRAGGFDTTIVGWGKEDVDLYEKFIRMGITIFRSVDPGLVHVYHSIQCDKRLNREQMQMCLGSKATSIASQETLARLFYKLKHK